MKRKLYHSLLEWKKSPDRKPLILEGARQVGKTWLLQEFGRNEYDNMVYINCHNNPFAHMLFQTDFDIERIVRDVEAKTGQRIVAGKTLIVFDEIQESPQGIASLKYFCENARDLHVAVAGSLLGVTHRPEESYPVGKVDVLKLFPMTFDEFVLAVGNEKLVEILMNCEWASVEVLSHTLEGLLRQYYYVGGMPEVVLNYVTNNDIFKVRKIQKKIISAYANDMAKHAVKEIEHIRLVWKSIAAQLSRENKKFIYGAVKSGGRARDLETAIQWLVDAGLVYKIHRCRTPQEPLNFYEDFDAFKLYLLDVGLLGALANAKPKLMLVNNDVFKEFKGAFTENYVLQQLVPHENLDIYYYSKENSKVEIDFLVQTDNRLLPIEVKAEENVKSKSFSQFINIDYAEKHLKGLRLSMKPYIDQGWMENIPLYSISGYINSVSPSRL
ncbi:MAG: ATP-binding protein [Prevotella sp.]|nr:ATP-binding protein [Prevotella sp.]MBR6494335.1 ATP-binding protein [Prevotella sp.]